MGSPWLCWLLHPEWLTNFHHISRYLSKTCLLCVFILRSTPNNTQLKYGCPFKIKYRIRHNYLKRLRPSYKNMCYTTSIVVNLRTTLTWVCQHDGQEYDFVNWTGNLKCLWMCIYVWPQFKTYKKLIFTQKTTSSTIMASVAYFILEVGGGIIKYLFKYFKKN